MTLNRIILSFVQPLLALLLMAGMAQAQPCLFDDDDQARVIERSLEIASTLNDESSDTAQAFQAPSAASQDDHPQGPHALAPGSGEFVLDHARLIRTARVSHSTAPPSPWPCAAPSTGPPLV